MSVVGQAKEAVGKREKRITDAEHWYKRTFRVESNNVKDDPNVIERAFGLPKYGFHYVTEKSIDLIARCVSMNVRQLSHLMWEVDVEYSSKASADDGGDGGGGSPIWEAPTWKWNGVQIRRVVTGQSKWLEYQDPSEGTIIDTTGILNSAFEPYNPPAEMDVFIPQLVFTRNEPTFNHRYMLWYVNSINKYAWYGWYKRTVKVVNIAGDHKFKTVEGRRYSYWRVTYTFQFNKETWDLFLLDLGSYYFEGGYDPTTQNTKIPFTAKGVPTLGLLTSDGDKSTSISRYNRYRILKELNLSKLMIPIPK